MDNGCLRSRGKQARFRRSGVPPVGPVGESRSTRACDWTMPGNMKAIVVRRVFRALNRGPGAGRRFSRSYLCPVQSVRTSLCTTEEPATALLLLLHTSTI